jgi:type IV pilus assembly protein PilB
MTNAELDARLSELLLGYNVVPATLLERARAYQEGKGSTLAGALAELRLVPADTLSTLLEELTGVRAVDPTLLTVYPDFVERMNVLIPPEVVAALPVFPAQMEINAIHVCMLNPTDGWTARTLEAIAGCRVMPFVSLETTLVAAIDRHYGKYLGAPARPLESAAARAKAEATYRALLEADFETYLRPAIALINRNRDAIRRDPRALEQVIRDPAIIRLVQQIICRAVEAGASDIHVEPTGEGLRVRARIDGAMRVVHALPPTATDPVVARLKAMAEVPIEPSSTPIDARIGYDLVWGRGIDLRFSAVPSVTGEKIVLRVLDRTRERRRLSDLGVDAETQALIERASDLPNGLLLVTGPTGSGKSSTLYALLDRLNGEDVCILTAEDPVESRIVGVTQIQCSEESGLSYAAALRSFLRQDPDIIMVGEIRDAETADIALKAALTGHLVMSTLHTNDAPGAVLRLLNMGLEPFIVASALRLVIAQRLVRRLCRQCRRRLVPGSEAWRTQMAALPERARRLLGEGDVYEPVGCPACHGSGYRGRVGLFEVLSMTEEIEDCIIRRASVSEIRAAARHGGMRTLREAGWRLVAAGDTSVAEVLEHTVADAEEQEPVPAATAQGRVHV